MNDLVLKLVEQAELKHWQVLLVGGAVRDQFFEKAEEVKDYDLEFYGPTAEELEEFLSKIGNVKAVGKSFGVYKLTVDDIDLDVSLPRRENKVGVGHKGFVIEADGSMTPEEAATRRDFTMNAIAMNVRSGEVLDYFKGLNDIKDRILKHTSDRFIEDPLRVLRGFQFCGRFGLSADKSTLELCEQLLPQYTELPKERVWMEWEKWADRSTKPSFGLKFLKKTGWLELYPELYDLVGLEQDALWHPEGDVFTHSCQSCDAMVKLCDEGGKKGRDRQVLMFAILCHDLGKVVTSEINDQGRIISRGHPEAGEEYTRLFLNSIGAPQEVIERVIPLVVNHMMHLSEHSTKSVRRLSIRLGKANIDELAYVITADSRGRGSLSKNEVPGLAELIRLAKEVKVQTFAPKPILKGRHLMDLGQAAGPDMGKHLERAYQAQLDGFFSTETTAIQWFVDHTK